MLGDITVLAPCQRFVRNLDTDTLSRQVDRKFCCNISPLGFTSCIGGGMFRRNTHLRHATLTAVIVL